MGKGARNRAIRKRAVVLVTPDRSMKSIARKLRKIKRGNRG